MTIKSLQKELDKIASKNMGKIIYSLFLMSILQTISCSIVIFPIVSGRIIEGTVGDIFSYILIAISGIIWLIFEFGFAAILLRMVKGEFVTLGFLFYGFKKTKISFPPVLIFLGMFAVAIFIAKIVFGHFAVDLLNESTNLSELPPAMQSIEKINELAEKLRILLIPLIVFSVISLFLIIIPFVFTFQFRLENPKKTVFWSMKQSISNIFKDFNYFRLIGFAILVSWKRLLIALTLTITITILNTNKALGIFVLVLEFFYFINVYTAIIRIFLTVPVMYNELTKKNEVGTILQIEV